jgi:hypothetical protein
MHTTLSLSTALAAPPTSDEAASPCATSAASRALGIPELVTAVLAHLPQPDAFVDVTADHDDAMDYFDYTSFDAAVAERAAARAAAYATLRAAVLVNRLWYAAGVPLLWACPSDDALHVSAVSEAARRAFYAAFIRHVYLTKRGALWRALTNADGGPDDKACSKGGGAALDAAASRVRGLGALKLQSLRVARYGCCYGHNPICYGHHLFC